MQKAVRAGLSLKHQPKVLLASDLGLRVQLLLARKLSKNHGVTTVALTAHGAPSQLRHIVAVMVRALHSHEKMDGTCGLFSSDKNFIQRF